MPLPTVIHLMVTTSSVAAVEAAALPVSPVAAEEPLPPQAARLSAIAPVRPSETSFMYFFMVFSFGLVVEIYLQAGNVPAGSRIQDQPLTAPTVRPEMKYFWKNG